MGVILDALKRAELVGRLRVRVGVLASRGGDAAHEGGDLSLVQLAAIHEFGSPAAGIPERSFIRSTFHTYAKDALRDKLTVLCKAALSGRMDPRVAIDLLGTWAVAEVRRTITAGKVRPPLAPSTIDAKGSSKPLVDTGQLVNAIAHEVVDEGV